MSTCRKIMSIFQQLRKKEFGVKEAGWSTKIPIISSLDSEILIYLAINYNVVIETHTF